MYGWWFSGATIGTFMPACVLGGRLVLGLAGMSGPAGPLGQPSASRLRDWASRRVRWPSMVSAGSDQPGAVSEQRQAVGGWVGLEAGLRSAGAPPRPRPAH